MPTDLKTKDDLRRELRFLTFILEDLISNDYEKKEPETLALRMLKERIEDIQKALEDQLGAVVNKR